MASTGGGLNLPAIVAVKVVGLQKAERDLERFGYRTQAQAKAAIAAPAGPPPPKALPPGAIAQPGMQQFKALGAGADPFGYKQAGKDLNELAAKHRAFQARLGQMGRNQDLFNTQKAQQDLADLRKRKQELDQGARAGIEPYGYRVQARQRAEPSSGQRAIGAGGQALDLYGYRVNARQRPFAGEIGAGGGGGFAGGGGGGRGGGGGGGFGGAGGPGWEPARGLGMDSIDRQIRDMVRWAQRNAELYRRMANNNQGILDEQVKLKVAAAKYREAYAKRFDIGTPGGKEATSALAGADYASRQRQLGQRAMTAELTLGRDASAGVWKRLEAGGTQREAATQHLEDQVKRQVSIEQSKLALEEGTAQEVAQEKVLRERLNREIAAQVRAQTDQKEVARENVAKRRSKVEQEREDIRATTPEDLGAEARLTVEKRFQRAEQQLAENAELRTVSGQKLLATEAQLAAETAELKAQGKQREAADTRLIKATAASANAEEERAARITLARGGQQFEDVRGPALIARSAAFKQAQEVEKRTAVLAQITDADREALARQKLLAAKERVAQRGVERRVFREAVASGEADRGTWFQRVQTRLHPASGKLPEEQLTGREFLGEKFQRTLGFAASGALIGFGTAAIAEMFKDAMELEQTFVRLRGQMEGIGKVDSFPKVRDQIKAIAADTGQASNEVATFYSRMLGLGNDPEKALADTASAMKLATVTGLDMKTMMQSLVPIQKAFGISAEDIGDEVVAMGEKFGIAEDDLVQFLGKTASVAKNAGLNFKELTIIGATVANSLGRPIDASAEAINKAFGQIENNADKIFQILQANPATQAAIPKMIEAMGAGESGQALIELLRASQQFEPGQRNAILKNVVSKREAEEFNALITNASSILDQLEQSESGATDSTGKLNQRFGDLKGTVATTFKSLAASFEAIGDALFQSGIGDFLVDLGRLLGTVVSAAGAVFKIFGALNELFAPSGVPLLSTLLKMAAVSGVLIKISDVLIAKKAQSAASSAKEAAADKLSEQQKRAAANTTVYFSGTKEQSATASVHETAAERENTATKQGLTHAATETAAAETNLARAKAASAAASQAAALRALGAAGGGPVVPLGPAGAGGPAGGLGAAAARQGLATQMANYSGMLGLLGLGPGRTRVGPAQYSRAGGLASGMLGLPAGMLGLPAGAGRGVTRFVPSPEIGPGRTRVGDANYARAAPLPLGWGPHAPPPTRMITDAQRAGALAVVEGTKVAGDAAARGAREAAVKTARSRFTGDAGGSFGLFSRAGSSLDYGAERALVKRMGAQWTSQLAPDPFSRLAQRRLVGYGAQRGMAEQFFGDEVAAGRPVTAGLGTRALAGGRLAPFKFAKADVQTQAAGEKALGSSPFAIAAIIAAGVAAVQGAYEQQAADVRTQAEAVRNQLKTADKQTLKGLAEQRASLWTVIAGAVFDMPTEQDMGAEELAFEQSTEARKALGFVVRPPKTDIENTKSAIDEVNKTVYKKFWESYATSTQQGMVDELSGSIGGRAELRQAGIIQRTLPVADLVPKMEGFWGTATKFGILGAAGKAQEAYNAFGDRFLTQTTATADGYSKLMLNLRGRDDEVSSNAANIIEKWQKGEGDKPDFAQLAKELAAGGNVVGAIEAAGGNVEYVLNTLNNSQGETFKSLDELGQEYQAGKITAAEYSTEAEKSLGFVRKEAKEFQGEMGARARGVVLATTRGVDDAMLKARLTAENVTLALRARGSFTPKAANLESISRMYKGANRQTRLDQMQTMVQANIDAADEAIAQTYDPEERIKAFAEGITLDDTTYQTRLQGEMGSNTKVNAIIKEIADSLGIDSETVSNELTKRAAETGKSLTVVADEWLREKANSSFPRSIEGSFKGAALWGKRDRLVSALSEVPEIRTDLPEGQRVEVEKINIRAGARKVEAKIAAAEAQGDNLRTAALNTREAYASWQDMLARSRITTDKGKAGATQEQVGEAYAEYIASQKSEQETLFGFTQLQRNRAVILAQGDPVKATAAQLSIANAELQRARGLGDKERTERATQAVMQLQQQEEENALNIIRGRMSVQAALVSEDPLASARKALEAAEFELGHAQGDADREQKQAAVIQAQKNVNNAISSGINASANLAITLANLRGDTVTAANLAVAEAKRQLDEAVAKGIKDETVLSPLKGAIEEANKQAYLAPVQKQISDLDYLYGLEQISLGDYISLLEAQLSALVYDSQEYRDLNMKIFQLKKGAQQDLGWSIPGSLTLPTLYEARRASATTFGTPSTPYQDNRNIQVNIAVNGAQDPITVAAQVSQALTDSLRGGSTYSAGIPVGSGA